MKVNLEIAILLLQTIVKCNRNIVVIYAWILKFQCAFQNNFRESPNSQASVINCLPIRDLSGRVRVQFFKL
jgi:hypothetical protein